MTLESREYLLRVPKDHCGGRSHLDIYGKVGFSAQCANKSLASEETALHGTFHYFCENVLWQQFLLCTPLFAISPWRFFFFSSFILLLQSWAGVRSGFFLWSGIVLLAGILQPSWVSHLRLCSPMEINGLVVVAPLGNFESLIIPHLLRPVLRPLHMWARPFSKPLRA